MQRDLKKEKGSSYGWEMSFNVPKYLSHVMTRITMSIAIRLEEMGLNSLISLSWKYSVWFDIFF